MPKLSQIRTSALDDLAEQLRYAPKATLRRQIEAVQALASEIDTQNAYDEVWVVLQITGYQPEIDEPAMLVGAALLADLSSFIERLCSAARLQLSDIHEPVVSPGELARRWNVSRRTVERYRRRGLLALRALDERGQARIVFPSAIADRFELAHPNLINRGGRFSRIDDAVRAQMVSRGVRYRESLGLSASAAAGRLARRYGRSRESIRQTLLREPAFKDDRKTINARQRRLMHRAWRAGIETSKLANRFGVSPELVRRIVREHRALLLRRLDLEVAASMASADADLPLGALDHPFACTGLVRTVIVDARELVEAARRDSPPDPEIERVRTLALAALIARAARGIGALSRFDPSATALDEIETDLRWAALLKIQLLRAQRSLIIRTLEERLGETLLACSPERIAWLHQVSIEAAGRAIDHHDPARGGRLAAPVSIALARALAREVPLPHGGPSVRALARSARLRDWSGRVTPWQRWLDPSPRMMVGAGLLGQSEQDVLALRYGLRGDRPRSLGEIASELGSGRRRVRLIERQALEAARR